MCVFVCVYVKSITSSVTPLKAKYCNTLQHIAATNCNIDSDKHPTQPPPQGVAFQPIANPYSFAYGIYSQGTLYGIPYGTLLCIWDTLVHMGTHCLIFILLHMGTVFKGLSGYSMGHSCAYGHPLSRTHSFAYGHSFLQVLHAALYETLLCIWATIAPSSFFCIWVLFLGTLYGVLYGTLLCIWALIASSSLFGIWALVSTGALCGTLRDTLVHMSTHCPILILLHMGAVL